MMAVLLEACSLQMTSNSEEELQRLINVAHAYCCKWRLRANVSKSTVEYKRVVIVKFANNMVYKSTTNSLRQYIIMGRHVLL